MIRSILFALRCTLLFPKIIQGQLFNNGIHDPWVGYIGSSCRSGNPACITENAECRSSVCQCKVNFRATNGICASDSIGCPAGRAVFLTRDNRTPLPCTVTPETCPIGYRCTKSTFGNDYVCCALFDGYCPTGSVPTYDSVTGSPRSCGRQRNCPSGFSCVDVGGRSICCSVSAQTDLCPGIRKPFIDYVTREPQRCGGSNAGCPRGYDCTPFNGERFCCSTTDIPNQFNCPANRQPFVDRETNQIQTCRFGFTEDCPFGFVCEYSGISNICCAAVSEVPLPLNLALNINCPIGTTPFRESDTDQPRLCGSTATSGIVVCPGGFTCESSAGICCSVKVNDPARYCPINKEVFINLASGLPQFCDPNNDRCPQDFECEFYDRTFTCCSLSATLKCPNGLQALSDAKGQIIYCSLGVQFRQICPTSHKCQSTPSGEVCCPRDAVIIRPSVDEPLTSTMSTVVIVNTRASVTNLVFCENRTVSFIDSETRGAKLCNVTDKTSCPLGYACVPTDGKSVCCLRSPKEEYCPAGMSPFISVNNLVISCAPDNPGGCPSLYSCQYSPRFRSYLCCTPTGAPEGGSTKIGFDDVSRSSTSAISVPRFCPKNSKLLNAVDNLPQTCQTLEANKRCPSEYVCHFPYAVSVGFCCKVASIALDMSFCPDNRDTLMSNIAKTPITCDVNDSAMFCPPLYDCLFQRKYSSYFCCLQNGITKSLILNKLAGALNFTCLPLTAKRRCLVEHSVCDIAHDICVCDKDFIQFKNKCVSEDTTTSYVNEYLRSHLQPVGDAVSETYYQLKDFLDERLNEEKSKSVNEYPFWNAIKSIALKSVCNCTDLSLFEISLNGTNV